MGIGSPAYDDYAWAGMTIDWGRGIKEVCNRENHHGTRSRRLRGRSRLSAPKMAHAAVAVGARIGSAEAGAEATSVSLTQAALYRSLESLTALERDMAGFLQRFLAPCGHRRRREGRSAPRAAPRRGIAGTAPGLSGQAERLHILMRQMNGWADAPRPPHLPALAAARAGCRRGARDRCAAQASPVAGRGRLLPRLRAHWPRDRGARPGRGSVDCQGRSISLARASSSTRCPIGGASPNTATVGRQRTEIV